MKKKIICLCFCLLVTAVVSLGQKNNVDLIIKAEVESIQDSSISLSISETKDTLIGYKVMKVCNGDFYEDKIKVAHRQGNIKNIKVGDKVIIQIEPTKAYRETAEDFLLGVGIFISEETFADFIFVKFVNINSCK